MDGAVGLMRSRAGLFLKLSLDACHLPVPRSARPTPTEMVSSGLLVGKQPHGQRGAKSSIIIMRCQRCPYSLEDVGSLLRGMSLKIKRKIKSAATMLELTGMG